MSARTGTVYLIHFDQGIPNRPDREARHYMGFTSDLESRLSEHERGQGSKLMAEVGRRGIAWHVSRTWASVDRHFERRLKRRKNAPRECPTCREQVAIELIGG